MPIATFSASKTVQERAPTSAITTFTSIVDYFRNDDNRNLFFAQAAEVNEVPMTDAHIKTWKYLYGANEYKDITYEDSKVLQMKLSGIKCPGVTVFADNTILAETVYNSAEEYAEYRFFLIDSKQKAEGARAFVWLFNLIAGRTTCSLDGSEKPLTTSIANIRAKLVQTEDDSRKEVVFSSSARVEVQYYLSSSLLKMIPMSIEEFEYHGSKKMKKMIEKDMEKNLHQFKEAYIEHAANTNLPVHHTSKMTCRCEDEKERRYNRNDQISSRVLLKIAKIESCTASISDCTSSADQSNNEARRICRSCSIYKRTIDHQESYEEFCKAADSSGRPDSNRTQTCSGQSISHSESVFYKKSKESYSISLSRSCALPTRVRSAPPFVSVRSIMKGEWTSVSAHNGQSVPLIADEDLTRPRQKESRDDH